MLTAYPVTTFGPDIYVRDTMGNLNGPYGTAEEAVLDHRHEFCIALRNALRSYVCRKGYTITHWYNDGAIRLAQGDGPNDLFVFIRADGTVRGPMTAASAHACMLVREAQDKERQP